MYKSYILEIVVLFRLFEKGILTCEEYEHLVERLGFKYNINKN